MPVKKTTKPKKSTTSKKTSSKAKRNPRDNLIPGAKDPRTITSEQKKAGRERKRQAQRMMDKILEYQSMTVAELKKHASENSDNMTVLEYTMAQYVIKGLKNDKIMLDMIDRHISKAPIQQETKIDADIKNKDVISDEDREIIENLWKQNKGK